jgi:hypothetical protein
LLRLLRSLPNDESNELPQRLRANTNSRGRISSSSSSSLLRSQDTSSLGLPRAISNPLTFLQPSQNSLGFELMIRHPIAYPALLPIESAYSDPPGHGRPFRGRTQSAISSESKQSMNERRISPLCSSTSDSAPGVLQLTETSTEAREPAAGSTQVTDSLKPSPYCDDRLDQINIRASTEVPISDGFAACVTSLYLETDHPLLGFFDDNLFLDDFVSNKPNFCSRFLVNALMSWACVRIAFQSWLGPFAQG